MPKSSNFFGQPIYGQLIKSLDREKIVEMSRKHGGEKYVKSFDGYTHLLTMLYAVIQRFDSLREIETSMTAEVRKLHHVGIDTVPKRSTLSDANARRPEKFFEEVYRDLYEANKGILSSDSRRNGTEEWIKRLRIIDSTTVSLFSNAIFKGVGRHPKTGKKKGGIKVHAVIHANESVPCDVEFTSAATNDSFMLAPSHYKRDEIAAMDRAYINYDKFEELTDRGVVYVTKMKKNLKLRIPGWCKNYTVKINGEAVNVDAKAQTFATLNRTFQNGDVVSVDFEMKPQICTLNADQGQYVECGPLLYCFAIPQTMTEDTNVYSNMAGKVPENPDFKCWSITPSGQWNYGMVQGEQQLTLVTDKNLLATAYPFDKETAPVSIEVDVTPVKWTILDNRYNPVTPSTNTTVANGSAQKIRLIPYGCTELRVTVFPTLAKESEKTLTEQLLVNPDFEQTSATAFNHGGVEKKAYLPYGWKVRGTLSGSSYGINRDAVNHHGENVCWYNTIPFPANFQLYQTIPASKLKAGTYRVTCQLWVANNKKGVTRLFANDNVAYFGSESDYQNCLTEGEEATFAGYTGDTGGTPFILKDMEVTVHVSAGESLTLGIRSGNMKSDGSVTTSNDGTGWFKVDNFRIELIEDDETAINRPSPQPSPKWEGAVFDLNGRKVNSQLSIFNSQFRKMVCIANGKKVML